MDRISIHDCTKYTNKELEDIFFIAAVETIRTLYPEKELPKDSVYVGNVYRNKHSISCQIKLPAFNLIVMCKYNCDTKKIECNCYELKSVVEVLYGNITEEGKEPYDGYMILNPKRR